MPSVIEQRGRGDRSAVWVFAGEQGRLVLATAIFLLLAAKFEADRYAVYGATVAVVAVLSIAAAGGMEMLAAAEIARSERSNEQLRRTLVGQALGASVIGGTMLTLGLCALQPLVLPRSSTADVFAIAFAELVVLKLVDVHAGIDQLLGAQPRAARLRIVSIVPRALAALVVVALPGPTLSLWSKAYLGSAVLGLVIAWRLVAPELRRVRPARPALAKLRLAIPFGLNLLGTQARADIDKPIVTARVELITAGSYLSSYRLLTLATAPVNALVTAAYNRFLTATSVGESRSEARRLAVPVSAVAAFCGAAMLVGAPVVPAVLGSSYDGTVDMIRWMAVLPLVRGLQVVPGNALNGLGLQSSRALLSWLGVLVNVVANLSLLPALGWSGALIATYLAEGLLAAGFWVMLYSNRRSAIGAADEKG